ncbi:MAG TPA: sodium:solute symporter, partial [Chitinophagaceae bacterium]|nr:sodium:solute symporter [Chitinophagaceae bacterium]
SGIIGGFFLALSYFGADQSQVGRYLTARSLKESRMGLLMNGFVKVPMQFLILLIGALVFTFYQYNKAPIFFNEMQLAKLENSALYRDSLRLAQTSYDSLAIQKQQTVINFSNAKDQENQPAAGQAIDKLRVLQKSSDSLRGKVKQWLNSKNVGGDGNDTNYIFLRFVVDYLPVGLVGLLIAIIFLASWGSIAAAINSLASCSMVDFHKRFTRKKESGEDEFRLSRWYTLAWGIFCIIVAMFTYNIGNSLIEAVNVLGSLFYGVILGVFLVAFFVKYISNGHVVFWAAVLAEILVLSVFLLTKAGYVKMGFLWLNPIGAFGVILFSMLLNPFFHKKKNPVAQ